VGVGDDTGISQIGEIGQAQDNDLLDVYVIGRIIMNKIIAIEYAGMNQAGCQQVVLQHLYTTKVKIRQGKQSGLDQIAEAGIGQRVKIEHGNGIGVGVENGVFQDVRFQKLPGIDRSLHEYVGQVDHGKITFQITLGE